VDAKKGAVETTLLEAHDVAVEMGGGLAIRYAGKVIDAIHQL